MDSFATVLRRLRRFDRDPPDADFDDYSSGDESCGVRNVLARDAAATVAAAAAAVRRSGGGEAAASFIAALATNSGQPSWRPLKSRADCAAVPGRRAHFRVAAGEDHINVSSGAFGFFVAALYVASFRHPGADVYAAKPCARALERNYELAKACVSEFPATHCE